MRALICLIGFIGLAAPVSAEECRARVTAGAASGFKEAASALSIVIPAGGLRAVEADIAAEICDPKRGVAEVIQVSAGRRAAVTYLSEAAEYGQTNDIRAIVSGVLDGSRGLGRVDRRTYGSLTVTCAAGLDGAEVVLSAQPAGDCGSRFLSEAGEIDIAVSANKVPICVGKTRVKRRDDRVCECSFPGGAQPLVPMPLNCN